MFPYSQRKIDCCRMCVVENTFIVMHDVLDADERSFEDGAREAREMSGRDWPSTSLVTKEVAA